MRKLSVEETSILSTGLVTYPVNLVKIIGQEYYAADNTRATGDFHFNIDMAEEEVECRLYSRRVSFFTNDECGTLGCAVDGASSCIPKLKSRVADSEIRIEGVVCQTAISRTCSYSLLSTCRRFPMVTMSTRKTYH